MTDAARYAPITAALKAEAHTLGFADCRVADPEGVVEAGRRLRAWIAEGRHGEMAWMADRLDWRADPRTLWPAVQSVVMLADSYTPDHDPRAVLKRRDRAAISVYADGRDYHDVVKKRLKRLGRWLIDRAASTGQQAEIKVFTDTAPVMEKPLAAAAGLGWQGKHTNLVSRDGGSWFFLGAIFTTLSLPADLPGMDRCGTCRRCLDVCPTDAFPAPYQLDARRCISYLTIELKGPIPRDLRAPIGNRVYGCDDCLAVCPWNRFAAEANAAYDAAPGARSPALADLATLDDAAFRDRFRGTPIKRTGRDRFMRNVAVAIGNSADASMVPVLRRLAGDTSALVRGHAAWGLGRLMGAAIRRDPVAKAGLADSDAAVRAEWQATLSEASGDGAGNTT
ncbi:MAG: tRNA epoxyqueuosine(34) reductase QueG [Pseudomonadota bacterium]